MAVETTLEVIDDPAAPVSPDAVEIRGRGAVHAVLALAAGAVAVAYAWRIGGGASAAWWALVAVLAVVTAVNLTACWQARTPQLVADEQGVRVRKGRSWLGLPWERIESVRVLRPAGSVGDSVLVLAPSGGEAEVRVPFGTARSVSAPDLLGALDELRREHARIALAGTVVTEAPTSRPQEPARVEPAEPVERLEPVEPDQPVEPVEPVEPGEPITPHEPAEPIASYDRTELPEHTQRTDDTESVEPQPGAEPPRPVRRTLSAVATARRAVRAQVHRAGPATVGSSALKHEPSVLPEISELRRTEGRVGLVIETMPARRSAPVEAPATAVGAAPVEAYPTQPAPEPLIGPQIASARTRLRVSVDDLADRTRIRPHVIESIEVDDFVPCGGDFYARGHLRALCRMLGIDAAPLLEIYDREYAHAPVAARRVFEAELAAGPQAAIRSIGGGPRWSVLLGVVMVLAIVWGAAKVVTERTAEPAPEPRVPSLSLPATPPQASGLAEFGAPRVNQVRLTASSRTRVTVRDSDGAQVWQGVLGAGKSHRIRVGGPATVTAANGQAVNVWVNGDKRGTLGATTQRSQRTVGRGPR